MARRTRRYTGAPPFRVAGADLKVGATLPGSSSGLRYCRVPEKWRADVSAPGGQRFKVTKGPVQIILPLAANRSAVEAQVEKVGNEFASRGFRSLAVARPEDHGQWWFLGVLPFYDPPREDSKAAIEQAQQNGVKMKMVPADRMAIEPQTARHLGLGTNFVDARVFSETSHTQAGQMDAIIEAAGGFAQVFAEHKYHIVNVLRKQR